MRQAIAGAAALCAVILSSSTAHATNCVAYVKSVTNFSLLGDAWAWWDAAANTYSRGHIPLPGAVMVFSRTSRMHVGHVAVVRSVRSSREILIDQANWHHGRVDTGVRVDDISANNDWSQVNVEWDHGYLGGPFPITGFVYAPGSPSYEAPHVTSAVYQAPVQRAHVIQATSRMASAHLVLAGGHNLGQRPMTMTTANHHAAIVVQHASMHPAATAAKHATPAASHAAHVITKTAAQ